MESNLHANRQNDTETPVIHAPVDVRSASLAVLATLAVIFTLHWAKVVLVPIALAVFLHYALDPAVVWLKRKAKVPSSLGAAFVLVTLVIVTGIGIAALQTQTLEMLDMLPRVAQKLELEVRRTVSDKEGAMSKLKKAASEIDKAASSATTTSGGPQPPIAAKPSTVPQVSTFLWTGSLGLAVGIAQTVIVLALVYFLLIAGDTFKRKLVRVSGDTLSKKKITVQILNDIDQQIQRYLLVQIGAAVAQGVLSWMALAAIGLQNAAFWGLLAGVFHLVPYMGPTVAIVLATIVAYLQFPDLKSVILVVASLLAITTLIGLGIMPWVTEKIGRLNAVTVFVSLLLWGWLWGIWGLLLGVPIVMAIHAICARIEELQPLAEMLGDEPRRIPKEDLNPAPIAPTT